MSNWEDGWCSCSPLSLYFFQVLTVSQRMSGIKLLSAGL